MDHVKCINCAWEGVVQHGLSFEPGTDTCPECDSENLCLLERGDKLTVRKDMNWYKKRVAELEELGEWAGNEELDRIEKGQLLKENQELREKLNEATGLIR